MTFPTRSMMVTFLPLSVVALAGCAEHPVQCGRVLTAHPREGAPAKGEPAPDFSFRDDKGALRSLSSTYDDTGITVLMFRGGEKCPDIQTLSSTVGWASRWSMPVNVVLILGGDANTSSRPSLRQCTTKGVVRVTLLHDDARHVQALYGPRASNTCFVIDDGHVVETAPSDDPRAFQSAIYNGAIVHVVRTGDMSHSGI